MEPVSKTLPSDHLKRLDLVYLKKGNNVLSFMCLFYRIRILFDWLVSIFSVHKLYFFNSGDITTAQQEKENLENLQRKDAKLRKDYQERRNK